MEDDQEFALKGDISSDSFKIIRIFIGKCLNSSSSSNCLSSETINKRVEVTPITMLLGDSYINFDNGVGNVYNSTKVLQEYFSPNLTKTMDILVRKNEYSYADSLIFDTTQEGKFYSFSDEKRYFQNIINEEVI